jgi:hypothetical protein
MQKLSTLARAAGRPLPALLLTALGAVMTGCGGGSDDPVVDNNPPPGGGNPPNVQPVEGIATPSAVAVVTATNAQ